MKHEQTKISKLALELAEALHDTDSLMFYESLTDQYAETLLRKTLEKVLEIPNEKIKKNRAALFNYLMQQHGQKKSFYSRT